MSDLSHYQKKMLYQCTHRGIKEGDVLLGAFAEATIHKMNEQELKALENFLDLYDQDILNYIYAPHLCPAIYQEICQKIYNFAFKKS
jgi:antitoxin CptB